MTVYVERKEMTGAERTFANSYRPNEDIIRYNSASKVHRVKAGEYARVIDTEHETNKITVRFLNGRELTYNPTRFSGVSVYYEAERDFAEGDRLQIRAPFRAKRIANGELGTITKIGPDRMRLAMDSGREISVELRNFRHLDHGYAVTSHSAQGLTFDRVVINADTQESVRLLNDRMAYVAISRARDDARIYTDSKQNLSAALNRGIDKITALEAVQANERDAEKALTRNESSPRFESQSNNSRQEQPPSIVDQSSKANQTIPTGILANNDPTLQDITALQLEMRDQRLSPETAPSHSDPLRSTAIPPQPSSQEQDHEIDLLH